MPLIEMSTWGVTQRWPRDHEKIFDFILENDTPMFKVGHQMYLLTDYPFPSNK